MNTFFKLEGTYDSPDLDFNLEKGIFKITGRSLPANSFDFYTPILVEIINYLEAPKPETHFEFKMDFISSSSTKIFQEIFYKLDKVHKNGTDVRVKWFYKFGDDDMKELGDDLRLDTHFPFEFVTFE